MDSTPIFLVSACLLGINSRYDGQSKPNPKCLELLKTHHLIPVCPEQLGGLSTPRSAADIIGGDGNDVLNGTALVTTKEGLDVTLQFVTGAEEVLKICKMYCVDGIVLKSRSPSCGIEKLGVTTALLRRHAGCKLYEL